MLRDINWPEDGTYSSQGEHTPFEFFFLGLANCRFFDLQLGFFNSAAIHALSSSFATFIQNGGYMRMTINQIVSSSDKSAIIQGTNGGIEPPFDFSDFESILRSLDEYGDHFFRCLAYLIQEHRLQVQIIRPKKTDGIAHTKKGLLIDADGMAVGFSGSANFTLGGLFNNLEDINVFFSTSPDPYIQNKLKTQKAAFDSIMNHEDPEIEYLSSTELVEAIESEFGGSEIEELLSAERELNNYRRRINEEINRVQTNVNLVTKLPRFPFAEGPRDYQQVAFENWRQNSQKGLFEMATGTGKTITSLNCLLEIYKKKGYYKALILVPTITLVNQWEQECRKFNFRNIIKVNSTNAMWRDEVERIWFDEKYQVEKDNEPSYIIIATYASYARDNIFTKLNQFDKSRLLLIADECHNMGSGLLIKRLDDIPYLRRIGLSATPERQYDEKGNMKLRKFFGCEQHYTYIYSMREAIDNGILCRYMYFPHIVPLTSDEMSEYVSLSEKISRYFNFLSGRFDNADDALKMLLLARKRIIHKAENKLKVFNEIIKTRYKEKGNLKYTLVYVPEGGKPDYIGGCDDFDQHDCIEDDEATDRLINLYTKSVADLDEKITVRKFISGQREKDEILDAFAGGKLQVLTSMKCLDEGVDVPRSELAIFCSSTGNPRQFVQRRGRVLRMHPDKQFAELHDLIVAPEIKPSGRSFRMEQALIKEELKRVSDFALLSENLSYSELSLRSVLDYYGLNIYNNEHIV